MTTYKIVYTDTAANDIVEKFRYIAQTLRDRAVAERWYERLKESIQNDLSYAGKVFAVSGGAVAKRGRSPLSHKAGCCAVLRGQRAARRLYPRCLHGRTRPERAFGAIESLKRKNCSDEQFFLFDFNSRNFAE